MYHEIIKRFGTDFTLRRCIGLISAGYGDEGVISLLRKFKEIIIKHPFSDKAKAVDNMFIQSFREIENEELITGYIIFDQEKKIVNVKLTASKYAESTTELNEVISLMSNPAISPEPDIPKLPEVDLPF